MFKGCYPLGHVVVVVGAMQRRIIIALLCAFSSVAGFVTTHTGAYQRTTERALSCPRAEAITLVEQIPRPDGGGFPFRTVVLALLTLQSAFGLAGESEMGGLITRMGDPQLDVNAFAAFLDAAFLTYGANVLLGQLGIIKEDPTTTKTRLDNMECQVTLNVGREPGTGMPKEWAVSGARLSLPMTICFSDELVDLGFQGEERLNAAGGRYAKKLSCQGGSFVNAQGEVVVKANGGAWATEASGVPGANTLNFFVDLPEQAARNDVVLPAGRLFFSGAMWESRDALPAGMLDGALGMPNGEPAGVVEGPGGVFMLNRGEISVKANTALNLWGALGDRGNVLGHFTVHSSQWLGNDGGNVPVQFTVAGMPVPSAAAAIMPLASSSVPPSPLMSQSSPLASQPTMLRADAAAGEAVPDSTSEGFGDLSRELAGDLSRELARDLSRELATKRARLLEVERREEALFKRMAEIDAKRAWLAKLDAPTWGPRASAVTDEAGQAVTALTPTEAFGSGDNGARDDLEVLSIELAAKKARLAELEKCGQALFKAHESGGYL